MNILRWGANIVRNISPAGLILAGTMLVIASPPLRRGLRTAAVTAMRGVLTAAGTVQGTMSSCRERLEDIAAEAQNEQDSPWNGLEQPTADYAPGWHQDALPSGETSSKDRMEPDGREAGSVTTGSAAVKKRIHGKHR